MTTAPLSSHELRVLLRMVTARDGGMAVQMLAKAGMEAQACTDVAQMEALLLEGAGALVIAEEVLTAPGFASVKALLRSQEAWSDIPVIVVARAGLDSPVLTENIEQLANVTVLERPMRVSSLVSTARSALAARRRQYELRDTLQGLREADQRKTEFLATLAHELRNPLAPLRSALAVLERGDASATQVQHTLVLMNRQVDHMVRLIDDLMEVSRITRGKIALQLQATDLREVLRNAVELSAPLIDAGRHRLVQQAGGAALTVQGDAVRLTQVFANLLNNAARYTPAGGTITLSLAQDGDMATVVVEDTGVGIPENQLEAVFDMFVQVHDAARAAQGGLGIGLTLVRSLVEMHGGTVEARHAAGGTGTRMVVKLPLAVVPQDLSLPHRPVGAPAAAADQHRVLVVDDNRDAADTMATLLELLGASAAVAYSGEEALRVAARFAPTIALLDIGMPGMDGYELAQRLQSDAATADVRLVAVTGWAQPADIERSRAARFAQHLVKPVDIQHVADLLGLAG